MTNMKLHLQQMTLACTFTLAFVGSTSYPSQVGAQSARPVNNIPSSGRVRFISPPLNQEEPDFSDVGDLGNGKEESRGGCLVRISRLSRLPTTNLGLTVTIHLLVYVPYTLTEQFVEFVLGMGKNDVYKTSYWGWEHRPVLSVFAFRPQFL